MKVLFIYPNSGSQIGFNYGIACLSARLKQKGHQVSCLQLCEEIEPLPSPEQFANYLLSEKPDLIGFSVVTNQWKLACHYAQLCRQTLSVPLICGGIHATVATEEVLNSGFFDFVMIGEADDAFPLFVETLEKGEDWSKVPNLGWKDDKGFHINPVAPLPDLKSLPLKDYELFNFQKIIDAKNGWVGLMASRGCPFQCTYCFNHFMVKKYKTDLKCSNRELGYIRHHSVSQVLDEIRYLLTHYSNIQQFIFDDDLFTYDRDFVLEFAEEYPKISRIPFVVNAHVNIWDEERAAALAKAGCSIVKFGVESGSDRVRREVMHRYMSNEKIKKAIGLVEQYGMHSSCFIMLGLPYETVEDLFQTVQLMAEAKPGRYRWTYFYPFPGTESYRLAENGGFIDFKKFHELPNFTDESCLDFGPEQNLLLRKVGTAFPWFVNARTDWEIAPFYQKKVQEILAMSPAEWEQFAPKVRTLDAQYSDQWVTEGKKHYAIRYNRFMGVISDYFLKENDKNKRVHP